MQVTNNNMVESIGNARAAILLASVHVAWFCNAARVRKPKVGFGSPLAAIRNRGETINQLAEIKSDKKKFFLLGFSLFIFRSSEF